jgi:hypothetical protein
VLVLLRCVDRASHGAANEDRGAKTAATPKLIAKARTNHRIVGHDGTPVFEPRSRATSRPCASVSRMRPGLSSGAGAPVENS